MEWAGQSRELFLALFGRSCEWPGAVIGREGEARGRSWLAEYTTPKADMKSYVECGLSSAGSKGGGLSGDEGSELSEDGEGWGDGNIVAKSLG